MPRVSKGISAVVTVALLAASGPATPSMAPVVVGMILGPLAEAQLRNAISIGEGSAMVFLQRPMSLTLVIIVLLVLVLPRLLRRRAPALVGG